MTANKKGRPPATQPATAYDRRRYLTLVQVLAASGSDEGIRQLCQQWGVAPVWDMSRTHTNTTPYFNAWATIRALAQHVIDYHREDT